jgi:YrbI family 3-deoxy-D-manno-octulosonate 8-phosphate phosphatase
MKLDLIKVIAFDFDGVFTDNFVYTDSAGQESVRCSREDSLGLNLLKKEISRRSLNIRLLIVSTESDAVVAHRARKLKIDCIQGVEDKAKFLATNFEMVDGIIPGLVFLGNDLNDIDAMRIAEYSVAPKSAVEEVAQIATLVIPKLGGDGFVRSFCETLIYS